MEWCVSKVVATYQYHLVLFQLTRGMKSIAVPYFVEHAHLYRWCSITQGASCCERKMSGRIDDAAKNVDAKKLRMKHWYKLAISRRSKWAWAARGGWKKEMEYERIVDTS
mmetsp:Transcript_5739/g.12630  ORF Transcript_5739/g.12630 Transcript_5739/m.12630 type:complete len:110 (+) Transcript_5739:1203-1532(+)